MRRTVQFIYIWRNDEIMDTSQLKTNLARRYDKAIIAAEIRSEIRMSGKIRGGERVLVCGPSHYEVIRAARTY